MRFIYNIFIFVYRLGIGITAIFNAKASLWVKGRKSVLKRIAKAVNPGENIIWFHCASLGEFEQGRPIIERIKSSHPEIKIFLTFFSPSGYEIRKNYKSADYIFYLPYDSPRNAKRLVEIVKPQMAIFVKYEFWFNYFIQLKKNSIPLYLVSGVFRKDQHFFKSWAYWQRNQLKNFDYFFLQDENSASLLTSIGFNNNMVTGDTRFDRVSEIVDEKIDLPIIEKFKSGKSVLCAGSSWPPDEDIILDYLNSRTSESTKDLKLIIAPHDISTKHIDELLKKFKNYKPLLYSKLKPNSEKLAGSKILIINSIGLLNKLYRFADIAYIGGGFGVAIHNLLEPAVYGIPVIYGPNHKNFREAIELAESQGGFPINNKVDFKNIMNKLLSDKDFYEMYATAAGEYISKNTGSSDMVLKKLELDYRG